MVPLCWLFKAANYFASHLVEVVTARVDPSPPLFNPPPSFLSFFYVSTRCSVAPSMHVPFVSFRVPPNQAGMTSGRVYIFIYFGRGGGVCMISPHIVSIELERGERNVIDISMFVS